MKQMLFSLCYAPQLPYMEMIKCVKCQKSLGDGSGDMGLAKLRVYDVLCRLSSNAEASLGPCPCYLHHFADYELSSRSWSRIYFSKRLSLIRFSFEHLYLLNKSPGCVMKMWQLW